MFESAINRLLRLIDRITGRRHDKDVVASSHEHLSVYDVAIYFNRGLTPHDFAKMYMAGKPQAVKSVDGSTYHLPTGHVAVWIVGNGNDHAYGYFVLDDGRLIAARQFH